jgi:hypothetical protein
MHSPPTCCQLSTYLYYFYTQGVNGTVEESFLSLSLNTDKRPSPMSATKSSIGSRPARPPAKRKPTNDSGAVV